MGVKLAAAVAVIALFSQGGCFSPSFDEGQFTCGPAGDCPPGFECSAGQCVRNGSVFDASSQPPDAAAAPDAAPLPPDAAPAIGARWYLYDSETDTWTSVPAAVLFGGTGPRARDVQAAWSHCGSFGEVYCFGTDTGWTCTVDDGATFFGKTWDTIDAEMAAFPPTHITHFFDGFSGSDAREVLFAADEKWWLYHYIERPLALLGGTWPVTLVTNWHTTGGFDELWAGDENAPPDPSAIVASFTGFEANRRWILWVADGTEYRFNRVSSSWENPEPSKLFELADAPTPGLVVAATRCRNVLYVLTRASN